MADSSKEIDLIKLIAQVITFIKKSKKIISLFFILGIILGIIGFLRSPHPSKYFYSKIISAQSSILISDDIIAGIINSLEKKRAFMPIGNTELASEMDLSVNTLNQLKAVSVEIVPSNLPVKIINVRFDSYNELLMDSFVLGLESYINKNEYVKNQHEFYFSQRKKLIQVIDGLLAEFRNDNVDNKDFYESNATVLKMITKGKFGFVDLLKKKQKAEKDLALAKVFDVVISDNPIESINIYYQAFKKILLFGFGGLFLGMAFSSLLNLYNKAKVLNV